MKKYLVKTCLLLCLVFFLGFIASCKKEHKEHIYIEGICECGAIDANWKPNENQIYTITYELNGGSLTSAPTNYDGSKTVILPTPSKESFEFFGWYDNQAFSGEPITQIEAGSKGNKVFYAKWIHKHVCQFGNLNESGFDGNGMSFGIKVPNVAYYDPFDENYIFEDKALQQARHNLVETSYNIDISYTSFPNDAQWGNARVNYIKSSFIDSSFEKNNVYSMVINSAWIPSLVKAQCLKELYNINENSGLFNDLTIDQDYFVNDLVSVRNKVYGYNTKPIQPEFLIYYNVDKVRELGLEDPTELWFKGEWTWSNFDSWVKDAQGKLGEGEYVIDSMHGDYAIGMSAAQGFMITDIPHDRVLFANNGVCLMLEKMKEYYNNGIWNKNKGFQDVTNKFYEGSTLLQNGRLYFYQTGFFDNLEFNLGIVPYPTDGDPNVSLYLQPYEYKNQNKEKIIVDSPLKKRNGEILTDKDGNEVYGIDLSKVIYRCPITSVDECFTILNYNYEEKFAISEKVILNILSDLFDTSNLDKEKTYYDNIYNKYYSDIDKAAISSVINGAKVYFEAIESIDYSIKNDCFIPQSWWISCAQIMYSDKTPKEFLSEHVNPYLHELESIYKS